MSKIKNIKEFFDLERRADLKGLEVGDYSLWSYLRIYYSEKFLIAGSRGSQPGIRLAAEGLKALSYGLRYLSGKYDYLAIIAGNQRKEINGKWVHPLDLLPPDIRRKTLFIELPVLGHKKRSELPDPRVVSRFWMILREFLWTKTRRVEKNDVYAATAHELEKLFGVSVRVEFLLKRFFAGRAVMDSVLDRYRPKAVFCAVGSSNMNYILACKERGIPVIEIQHGYIGTTHSTYNLVRDLGAKLYPDYFLAWGEYEREFFSDPANHFIPAGRVFPVGNFYLESIYRRGMKIRPAYRERLKRFTNTVAMSVQDPLEGDMLPFIVETAALLPAVAFLILPRTMGEAHYRSRFDLPDNVVFFPELNTYEGIIIADVHTTIWSTMAFESLAFGRANLLINPGNMAKNMFGHLLDEKKSTLYADSPADFVEKLPLALAITGANSQTASNYFFRKGFEKNIAGAVEEILAEKSVRC